MADINASRNIIQIEETSFRSALSESLMQRMGAVTNFISKFQHLTYQFNANGQYFIAPVPVLGFDGIMAVQFDIEITGLAVWAEKNQGSGSTVIDLHRLTGGNTDAGSIFGTKITVPNSAADFIYATKDLVVPANYGSGDITLPTFNVTQLNAGDALRADLDSVMSLGENISVYLFYRPR